MPYDILIIGGGPGGTEAALQAGISGLKTGLISATQIGGRATWSSLLPSKVWLHLATHYQHSGSLARAGLSLADLGFNPEQLRTYIREAQESQSSIYARELIEAGVTIHYGQALIQDAHTVQVTHEHQTYHLKSHYILIATGSGPRFLPEIKPNGDRIIAPRLSPQLPEIPSSVIVAGGGVTGTEYAYAFAALGAHVTLLHNTDHLLPRIEKEVANAYATYLQKQLPLEIHCNEPVKHLRQEGAQVVAITANGNRYLADYGFIAIGRTPDLNFYSPRLLPLAQTNEEFIQINEYCQTSLPTIYAVGDITGAPMTVNKAFWQARQAIAHITGKKANPTMPPLIEAIYTHPSVAQIGTLERTPESLIRKYPFTPLLKARLQHASDGWVILHVQHNSGKILGAAGWGPELPEIMACIQGVMQAGGTMEDLTSIPFAHPTLSELLSQPFL